MAKLTPRQAAAYAAKCAPRETGCVEWTGCRNPDGYGQFMASPKLWKAHRLAWTMRHGDIPHGLHVLHRCDNPACVSADHLFLGTHLDNMRDRSAKGRTPPVNANFLAAAKRSKKGAENPRAKLTAEAVQIIRTSDRPVWALAAQFGVTSTAVRFARNGTTWGA